MSFPFITSPDGDGDDDQMCEALAEALSPGMRDVQIAYAQMQMEQRRAVVKWGALICSCRRRFDWTFEDTRPPQADCPVHGVIAFNPMTGEML